MNHFSRIIKTVLLCMVTATAQASFISTADIAGGFSITGFADADPNNFSVDLTGLTSSTSGGTAGAVINVPPPGTYDVSVSGTLESLSTDSPGVNGILAGLLGATVPLTGPLSGALSFPGIFLNPGAFGLTIPGLFVYDAASGAITPPGGGTPITSGAFDIAIPGGIPNPHAAFSIAAGSMHFDITSAPLAQLALTCTGPTPWCGLGTTLKAVSPGMATITGSFSMHGTATAVPEPASLSLLALGLLGLGRKKRAG